MPYGEKRSYYVNDQRDIWLSRTIYRLRQAGYVAHKSEIIRAVCHLAREVLEQGGDEAKALRTLVRTAHRSHPVKVSVYIDTPCENLLWELQMEQIEQGEKRNLSDVMEGLLVWVDKHLKEPGRWEHFIEVLLSVIPDEDKRGTRTKVLA
jgi:hypothetical protein